MTNHLKAETSPYLQQHQDNPVDWYPWGTQALQRARKENKLIFLSIGYAACHWCHVMAHESFEDPDTAAFLNDNFINIKVDREERPDIDAIYLDAVISLTGQGGWPLNVFLTPDLKPFYGGTYFPPDPRHGMPAFRQVLETLIDLWATQREELTTLGQSITDHITPRNLAQSSDLSIDLSASLNKLQQTYDWRYGGWGKAPRFPQPMMIDFLLQKALAGEKPALEMAVHLLDQMSRGGLFDLVGGGFHRYSTDDPWLVPHFEKMLYDNAQLARVYVHAYNLTKREAYRWVAEKTLAFLQREMRDPQGGFYASLDADTDAGEGRYYTWTLDELANALTPQELTYLKKHVDLSSNGNFENGLNILQAGRPLHELASEQEESSRSAFLPRLSGILQKLHAIRKHREAPKTDHKIITGWNALAIMAFAEAGSLLSRPDFIQTAAQAASFVITNLKDSQDQLKRSWSQGEAKHHGVLRDYALMNLALGTLYQTDFDLKWYQQLLKLFKSMQAAFLGDDGLYFDAAEKLDDLILRPRKLQDNTLPSGNAAAAKAHLMVASFENRPDLVQALETMLAAVSDTATHYPTHHGTWLQVMDRYQHGIIQTALVTDGDLETLQPFFEIYYHSYRPYGIIAAKHNATSKNLHAPELLQERVPIQEKPTAYVCQGFRCLLPTTKPAEFQKQITKGKED